MFRVSVLYSALNPKPQPVISHKQCISYVSMEKIMEMPHSELLDWDPRKGLNWALVVLLVEVPFFKILPTSFSIFL
jgi:hypothetical protein